MAAILPTLRPYPAYKPSSGLWLGNVPEHWEARRLKAVCQLAYGDSLPADARGHGVIHVFGSNGPVGMHTEANTEAPCIVVGRKGSFGKVHYSTRPVFAIDTTYYVDERNSTANLAWLSHVLGWLQLDAVTRDSAIPGLNREDAYHRLLALPPLPEQRAIVRYLDHVDRRIRRYVSAKRKLIALLEEEKRAIVNQAVTRGLDPNVRLQPSGVEWLGDVPEHWEVVPVKRAFLSMDYGISESASDSGTIRLLTMGHLKDGQVMVPNDGGVDSVAPHLLLEKGDLLFNRTNSQELVGKVGLFVGYDSPVTFASYLVRMRPHPSHEPEYLNVALNDSSFISRARREAIPSLHQSNLNPTRYGRIHIALPPKEEQGVILRTLRKETASLRDAIARARRQVELVQEYRTRLIADVVTGKLDVREAASQLPDESDEEGPIDRDGLVLDNMDDGSSDVSQLLEEEQTMEREVTA